jgi:GTPase Era involved in 16S rRNA processing
VTGGVFFEFHALRVPRPIVMTAPMCVCVCMAGAGGILRYVFLDTPGQIEIFTWSASGSIITETLASSYRTVLLYVIDTPRTASPITFMSNMTYACSIMYRTKLPMILVFNKTDVMSHDFAVEWMQDNDTFDVRANGILCVRGKLLFMHA